VDQSVFPAMIGNFVFWLTSAKLCFAWRVRFGCPKAWATVQDAFFAFVTVGQKGSLLTPTFYPVILLIFYGPGPTVFLTFP
jgi:hypothetical protein